ncbi:hypothetical protein LIER_06405 [Lithospermum erythrorhizon]|uniref:RNase H type-1 domain-containing protein n=1 Tax=Lithospermum erythrorhizon TaxID=34254 RepID=A0AAV3P8Z8_LITER
MSRRAVGTVLVREAEAIQKLIYYVSHVLHGLEENYPIIDVFTFALVISASKLKPYFESYRIKVIIDQPLKRIPIRPALSGRITTWAIELSDFEITYEPRTSIKAHALGDFVTECTTRQPPHVSGATKPSKLAENPKWVVHVDRARNIKSSGAGIIIQGPDEITMEYTLRFSYETTNNEAEYEAMIAGLMLVKSLGVQCVLMRGDSKLIMPQIKGDCGVKNEILIKYHEKAVTMAKGFEETVFDHVPRAQNEEADRLSQLATTYYHKLPKEGIELVGKLPKAKGGVEYAVVAVDYFSKWVEVMNRIVFSGLKKTLVQTEANKATWPVELPTVLWSLHTTPSHAMGETPFALVYGAEAILPMEVSLPTYRQWGFEEAENNQRMRKHLNFTDELRDTALYKMVQYKHLVARSYNHWVHNKQLKMGDLVMRVYAPINHTWRATKLQNYYA